MNCSQILTTNVNGSEGPDQLIATPYVGSYGINWNLTATYTWCLHKGILGASISLDILCTLIVLGENNSAQGFVSIDTDIGT